MKNLLAKDLLTLVHHILHMFFIVNPNEFDMPN
jgi:hypothetical protein